MKTESVIWSKKENVNNLVKDNKRTDFHGHIGVEYWFATKSG